MWTAYRRFIPRRETSALKQSMRRTPVKPVPFRRAGMSIRITGRGAGFTRMRVGWGRRHCRRNKPSAQAGRLRDSPWDPQRAGRGHPGSKVPSSLSAGTLAPRWGWKTSGSLAERAHRQRANKKENPQAYVRGGFSERIRGHRSRSRVPKFAHRVSHCARHLAKIGAAPRFVAGYGFLRPIRKLWRDVWRSRITLGQIPR